MMRPRTGSISSGPLDLMTPPRRSASRGLRARRGLICSILVQARGAGRTFVAAGDDYLGVDLSFSMLGAFLRSTPHGGRGRRAWSRLTAEPCRFATRRSTLS
jgi:hypothetical protein